MSAVRLVRLVSLGSCDGGSRETLSCTREGECTPSTVDRLAGQLAKPIFMMKAGVFVMMKASRRTLRRRE